MSKPPEDLIIRPPSLEDSAGLHELRTLPGCMWGTLQMPTLTPEAARKGIETWYSDPNSYGFVADLGGKVVGSAGLHTGTGKRRHTGDLGIMVHDDYTGRGIGRALMESLLDIADNYLGLKRVELEVITDNEAGIALYRRLGFVEEGVKRCSVFRGGVFVDTVIMGRVR